MRILEHVIQVRELPPALAQSRQHLPSLRDLVRSQSQPEEPSLLTYLAQGRTCGVYNDRGLAFDVLQPGQSIPEAIRKNQQLSGLWVQPSLLLTDGRWLWSGVLPYYVAMYHLHLPEPFVEYARQQGWAIGPTTELAGDDWKIGEEQIGDELLLHRSGR